MVKAGILQITLITRQHFGTTPTFCTKCKGKISFKLIRGDSSYTKLCKCGCLLIQFHKPDKHHKTLFYTQKFISAKKFDPEYAQKDEIERKGFKLTEKPNGKKVYAK